MGNELQRYLVKIYRFGDLSASIIRDGFIFNDGGRTSETFAMRRISLEDLCVSNWLTRFLFQTCTVGGEIHVTISRGLLAESIGKPEV